jgi:hypothetical protein
VKKYFLILLLFSNKLFAQFAPAAGEVGTTAIHKDSSIFINWAVACSVQRGFMNVSIPDSGYVYSGDSTMAAGKALENGVVSLGDGGTATCSFSFPISNGPGFDFAVFENSFTNNFLELAFVEVSSNGSDFFRFNSTSFTDTTAQIGPFDYIEPMQINNLAGKYKLAYGTPFDLEELQGLDSLDINKITHVRIIDVVGSINSLYASRDGDGRKINDPWPTQFFTGGFDLDAIGVVYQDNPQFANQEKNSDFLIYPNPCKQNEIVYFKNNFAPKKIEVFDFLGRQIHTSINNNFIKADFLPGNYFIKLQTPQLSETYKFIVTP